MKKTGTHSVLLIILLAGIVWFACKFAQQRNAYRTFSNADPYAWIPQKDTAVFLEISGTYHRDKIKPDCLSDFPDALPGSLFSVIENLHPEKPVKKYRTGKTVVGFYPEGEILWHQVKPGEKKRIPQQIGNLFPAFSPVKEKIGNITVCHYPLEGNRFFSCFIEEGIFCGTCNRQILLESLLARGKNNALAADSSFKKARKHTGEFAPARLFARIASAGVLPDIPSSGNRRSWAVFDLNVRSGKLWINGYLPDPEITTLLPGNKLSVPFDPCTFSSRMAYGYCTLPVASAFPRDCFPPSDSLLNTSSVLAVYTICLPAGHLSRRTLQYIKAFRLQSPDTFRQKLSALWKTDIHPDSVYACPLPAQIRSLSARTSLALSGEYLYLSFSGNEIRQFLSDLQENRTLATWLPDAPWEQIGEDAFLVATGRLSEFPPVRAIPLPPSLISVIRQTCFIAGFISENPSLLYCNLCLIQPSTPPHLP